MLDQLPRPVVFAHRGASMHAPENTIAAFTLAAELGADAVELDVKLSADREAVVIHDQTVDRTTNGSGRVNELTLAELKQLDASYRFPECHGERIPTLDDVFEGVGKRVFINVELTNYSSRNDDLVTIVAEIVKKHEVQKNILFSSFLPENLRKMKLLLPDVPVGILASSGVLGVFSRSRFLLNLSPSFVHPYRSDVNQQYVEREHKRGRRVHVWTVNEEKDLTKFFEMGVDGVFTDDSLKALKLLGRK